MYPQYPNLSFPICSLFIASLLIIMYFGTKNVKNSETKLYSKLLKYTFVIAVFTFLLTLGVDFYFSSSTNLIFEIAFKVLYSLWIIWTSIVFLYFSNLAYESNLMQLKLFKHVIVVLDIILIFLIFVTSINITYNNGYFTTSGTSLLMVLIGVFLYLFLMIIVSVINYKDNKDKKKYIPLITLTILFVIVLILKSIDHYISIEANVTTVVALIMYFTIENPDLKMLNKLRLAEFQVEKSSKVKLDFLSSMSHEVRTPLNAIVGYGSLIKDADTLSEAKNYAGEIINSSNVLLGMFESIIDMKKIETNKISVKNKYYDFSKEIKELLTILKPKIVNKGLKLNVNINFNNILYGDINIIKMIITHIMDNAIKYTSNGSISFNAEFNDNLLKITITDTGIGIKKENLENIFEMFERGTCKNSNLNGMGLGLTIAKRLTDLLGGRIIISSRVNVGTKVTILIRQKERKNANISSR